MILTVGALYFSSLCSSVIWSFVATMAATILLIPPVEWAVRLAFDNPELMLVPGMLPDPDPRTIVLGVLLVAAFVAPTLGAGLANHRSAERTVWRTGRQLAVLSGCLACVLAAWIAVATLR